MHLAEGTLPLAHAAAWSVLAAGAVTWGVLGERSRRHDARQRTPEDPAGSDRILLATATSLLFAATLLPLPVPVVGATSHICLTPALALLLGPRRVVVPTLVVLLLHALFFAHGGLTTLGANIVSLGVVGPLVAVAIARIGCAAGAPPLAVVAFACFLGDLAVYVADAAILALGLSDSIAPQHTFVAVLIGFAPVQLPLALLDGAIGVGLMRLLAHRRPEFLPAWLSSRLVPAAAAVLLLAALVGVAEPAQALEGIDDSVFGAAAARAGRGSQSSLIDLGGGELGLTATVAVLFGAGFVAGKGCERLFGAGRVARR